MTHRTCHACRQGYDDNDSSEHECPSDDVERRLAALESAPRLLVAYWAMQAASHLQWRALGVRWSEEAAQALIDGPEGAEEWPRLPGCPRPASACGYIEPRLVVQLGGRWHEVNLGKTVEVHDG